MIDDHEPGKDLGCCMDIKKGLGGKKPPTDQ
jgi:hypothetical protein